jgi:hypothetical protein
VVAADAPSSSSNGTRDAPIALLSDGEDDKSGMKRKAAASADGTQPSGKRRKTELVRPRTAALLIAVCAHSRLQRPFHPELAAAIEELKAHIDRGTPPSVPPDTSPHSRPHALTEDWTNKGKFPPAIKPVLGQVALTAIRLNEYDDNFFNLMPRLFPYNRFTMMKLIKRTVFPDHVKFLTERQDELLKDLKAQAEHDYERAQSEYEKAILAWGASPSSLLITPIRC